MSRNVLRAQITSKKLLSKNVAISHTTRLRLAVYFFAVVTFRRHLRVIREHMQGQMESLC